MAQFNHSVQPHAKKSIVPLILTSLLVCLLVVGAFGGISGVLWYQKAIKLYTWSGEQSKNITIEKGSSIRTIATKLKDTDIIRNKTAFELYVRLNKKTAAIQAGSYTITPSSVRDLVSTMEKGFAKTTNFTIIPGQRVDQIRKKFLASGFSEQDVNQALKAQQYYAKFPKLFPKQPTDRELEGYLYPETFQISTDMTATQLVEKALAQLDQELTLDLVAEFKLQDLTVYEGIILASIIEMEVPKAEDRKVVSQIFHSRLDDGTPLGSDVTYYYAAKITGDEPFPELESLYNTRKYKGLPPGPISNPSKTSIEAAAYPAITSYFFFVTGDDGTNYFSTTDAEHQKAIAQYCKIACAPGYVPATARE